MEREREQDLPEAAGPGDYGYDLVHELKAEDVSAPAPRSRHLDSGAHVATETADDGQDLSYDLAHDVPQARRE